MMCHDVYVMKVVLLYIYCQGNRVVLTNGLVFRILPW